MPRVKAAVLPFLMPVVLVTLSGCFSLGAGNSRPETSYILQDYSCIERPECCRKTAITIPAQLILNDTSSPAYLNSRSILFHTEPQTLAAYQFASWVEPAPERLTTLLLQRLECGAVFKAATRSSPLISADYILDTSLEEFIHDASSPPGKVRIRLRAELVSLKERAVIASADFAETQAVETYDARGAVNAFSKGVSAVLSEIIDWLIESGPAKKR